MSDRRIDAFFYGLFMDSEVLKKFEVEIVNPRKAYADDFALSTGNRATLVATIGARAYGMVFSVTHAELKKLYCGVGLEDYCPEAIFVNLMGEKSLPAICYSLLTAPLPDEANFEYAEQLRITLKKLKFPPDYIASVE